MIINKKLLFNSCKEITKDINLIQVCKDKKLNSIVQKQSKKNVLNNMTNLTIEFKISINYVSKIDNKYLTKTKSLLPENNYRNSINFSNNKTLKNKNNNINNFFNKDYNSFDLLDNSNFSQCLSFLDSISLDSNLSDNFFNEINSDIDVSSLDISNYFKNNYTNFLENFYKNIEITSNNLNKFIENMKEFITQLSNNKDLNINVQRNINNNSLTIIEENTFLNNELIHNNLNTKQYEKNNFIDSTDICVNKNANIIVNNLSNNTELDPSNNKNIYLNSLFEKLNLYTILPKNKSKSYSFIYLFKILHTFYTSYYSLFERLIENIRSIFNIHKNVNYLKCLFSYKLQKVLELKYSYLKKNSMLKSSQKILNFTKDYISLSAKNMNINKKIFNVNYNKSDFKDLKLYLHKDKENIANIFKKVITVKSSNMNIKNILSKMQFNRLADIIEKYNIVLKSNEVSDNNNNNNNNINKTINSDSSINLDLKLEYIHLDNSELSYNKTDLFLDNIIKDYINNYNKNINTTKSILKRNNSLIKSIKKSKNYKNIRILKLNTGIYKFKNKLFEILPIDDNNNKEFMNIDMCNAIYSNKKISMKKLFDKLNLINYL